MFDLRPQVLKTILIREGLVEKLYTFAERVKCGDTSSLQNSGSFGFVDLLVQVRSASVEVLFLEVPCP